MRAFICALSLLLLTASSSLAQESATGLTATHIEVDGGSSFVMTGAKSWSYKDVKRGTESKLSEVSRSQQYLILLDSTGRVQISLDFTNSLVWASVDRGDYKQQDKIVRAQSVASGKAPAKTTAGPSARPQGSAAGSTATRIEIDGGSSFVKTGAKSWVYKDVKRGTETQFNEVQRTNQYLILFDGTGRLQVTLDFPNSTVWTSVDQGEQKRTDKIVKADAARPAPAGATPPSSSGSAPTASLGGVWNPKCRARTTGAGAAEGGSDGGHL